MICDELHDSIIGFAADLLEAEERAAVARHLDTGCPRCIGALASAHAALARLPALLEPAEPPSALRHSILEGVLTADGTSRPDVSGSPPGRGWRPLVVAAAAALLAGLAVGALAFGARITTLERELASARADLQELERRGAVTLAAFEITRSADVKTIELRGPGLSFRGDATLYWEWRTGDCLLRAKGLALDPGQRLALWFSDEEGEALRGGRFEVDASGEAMHLTRLPHAIDLYGDVYVTIEAADEEVEAPTGARILEGALEG